MDWKKIKHKKHEAFFMVVKWAHPATTGCREKLETGPTPKELHPGSSHFLWKEMEVQMRTTLVFVLECGSPPGVWEPTWMQWVQQSSGQTDIVTHR